MIDATEMIKELPMHGLHVARNKNIFQKTFGSIALSLLKYEKVVPGDYLEVRITLHREISTKGVLRSDLNIERKKIREELAAKRKSQRRRVREHG